MASKKITNTSVVDLRELKADRCYLYTGPQQSGVFLEFSGDAAGPFTSVSTTKALPAGPVRFFGGDFVRMVNPNNASGVTIFVTADPVSSSSGGCGDPTCQETVSGSGTTVSNEAVTLATFPFSGDGTYTITWQITGAEIATGKILSWTMVSYYTVIGGVAAKVSDGIVKNVDQPTGFGGASSQLSGTSAAALQTTGKLNSPASWTLGGCVQRQLNVPPGP